jgi:cytidylate kinase
MKDDKRVVIIFGFSGSGKSTIANELGKKMNLRVIHPSGILRDLLQNKKPNLERSKYGRGFWESDHGVALFKNRLHQEVPPDVEADQIILKEIEKGGVIIDSWNLPWLSDIGVRIYLQAPLLVRARRVAQRSRISYAKAYSIVSMKDEETRKLFLRVYGFDIKEDHENRFDLVIKTKNIEKKEVINTILRFLS